jgi:mannose-6-phosphate isomerase-like protein (cupin superfamily)
MRAALLVLATAAAVGGPMPAPAADTEQMIALDPRTLKYAAVPDLPDCATAAILRGDPRSGPAWVLLKLASGCRVPWHWHTANETLLVISGRGTLAMKDGRPLELVPGAYASLPSRHMHQMSCARSCLLFSGADAAFDIHYVDANGEEISARKALVPSPKTTKRKR